MREWTEAITDRSRLDIMEGSPKAYLHDGDLNRIENNLAYLSERLSLLGYSIQIVAPKNWSRSDIPRVADIGRICDRIAAITQAYYAPDGYIGISDIRDKALDYRDINSIEKNLSGIKDLIDRMLTHSYLRRFTHGGLRMYTHEQIRKGDVAAPAP